MSGASTDQRGGRIILKGAGRRQAGYNEMRAGGRGLSAHWQAFILRPVTLAVVAMRCRTKRRECAATGLMRVLQENAIPSCWVCQGAGRHLGGFVCSCQQPGSAGGPEAFRFEQGPAVEQHGVRFSETGMSS